MFTVFENGAIVDSRLNPPELSYFQVPVACGCGHFHIRSAVSTTNCDDPDLNGSQVLLDANVTISCDDGGGSGGGSGGDGDNGGGDDNGNDNGGGGGGTDGQTCDIRQAPVALPEDLNPILARLRQVKGLGANQVNRLKRLFSIQSGPPTADGVEAALSELEATAQGLREMISAEYDYLMPGLRSSWNPQSVEQYRVMLDQLAQTTAYYIQQENTYALLFASFTVALQAEAYAMLVRDYIAGLPQTQPDDAPDYAFYYRDLENSASVEQMLNWLNGQLTLQQVAIVNQQQAQQRAIDDLLAEKPKSFEVLSTGPDTGLPAFLGDDFRTLGVTERPFMPTPYIGGGGGSSGARAFRPASPNGRGHDRSSTLPTLIGTFLAGASEPLVNAARRIFFNHKHGRNCEHDYAVTEGNKRANARKELNDDLRENGEDCQEVEGKREQAHHIMPLGYENAKKTENDVRVLKFPNLVDNRYKLQECLWDENYDRGLNSTPNGVCLDAATHSKIHTDDYIDKTNCIIEKALQRGGCHEAVEQLGKIKDRLKTEVYGTKKAADLKGIDSACDN